MLELLISERTVRSWDCATCAASIEHVTGFLHDGSGAVAAYFAACHRHPSPEVGIDVVLGTWGRDDTRDHVTFSCRLRASGAMLVDATVATDSTAPILGTRLTREEALRHTALERLWEVTDFVSEHDVTISGHLHGGGASSA